MFVNFATQPIIEQAMAGKCKEMNKIKQALRLHLDGESNRSIGRKLDLYKGTVNKYINMAESCGIPIPALLTMEEPEIERVLTGGNPAYSDNRFQELKERLPHIASELERKHVTMYLLWREYRMSNPDGYGYTQFCYHFNQYTEARKPSFVLSPGNRLCVSSETSISSSRSNPPVLARPLQRPGR